jgi:two-component system, LytTR family, sensor kinase
MEWSEPRAEHTHEDTSVSRVPTPSEHVSARTPLSRLARSEGAVILGAWTVVALVFAGHNYLTYAANARPVPFSHALWWSVAEWYTWALLTPLVIWLARRFRLAQPQLARNVAALVVLAAVVAALQVGLEYAADRLMVALTGVPDISVRVWLSDGLRGRVLELAYLLPRKIGFSYITFWGVALAVHAVDYYRLYRERELRAVRLEGALAAAQLRALQAQLQPHFLFNTLNTIASLIPEDPAAAEETIESLSELLRAALRGDGAHEIALAEELELVDQYLRIQEVRFHDRLRVERRTDPDALSALVPPLLLQPLTENAIRHGIAPRPLGGVLTLTAERREGWLVLTVEDDGGGFRGVDAQRANGESSDGVGLANTRARLERLYGDAARLDVGNRPGGGAYARVRLPLRVTAGARPLADVSAGVVGAG